MAALPETIEEKQGQYVFFVYIVESPSAADLYHGRSEGSVVANALRLDSIPCITRTAINPEAFMAALRIGLPEAMKQFRGRYPILHLSAHGGSDGIQLSSGDIVTWQSLRELLVPINRSLQGVLLLCMSACEGYSACRMAMEIKDSPHPYFAMIGNSSRPTWSDTAVSYLAFYHLLSKGWAIPDAVNSMKAASGEENWIVQTADQIKKDYIEFLKSKIEPVALQRELETVAREEELSRAAQSLKQSQIAQRS